MKSFSTSILFLFFVVSSYGQEQLNITWTNDTVYSSNHTALFLCRGQTKGTKSLYIVRNLDKKSLIAMMFEEQDTVLKTSINFISVGLKFNVLFPKIKTIVLLESFVKNKIIVDGAIDTSSLQAYCKERDLQLQNTIVKRTRRPGESDSLMKSNLAKMLANSAEFTVVNKTNKPVSVQIGKPSSNRTQILNAGENYKTRGMIDETVCILDKQSQPAGCRIIKKTDKEFVINKSGTGFE